MNVYPTIQTPDWYYSGLPTTLTGTALIMSADAILELKQKNFTSALLFSYKNKTLTALSFVPIIGYTDTSDDYRSYEKFMPVRR